MDYGNNNNNNSAAEFNWSYMGGASGQGGQGGNMSSYPQMSQMNPGSYGSGGGGGGQQWLHSNQNDHFQQPAMAQNSSAPASYEAYNQSMMRYANQPKSAGYEMGQMGQMGMSSPMGGNYGGHAAGMSRNGLGGMGQSSNGGFNRSW